MYIYLKKSSNNFIFLVSLEILASYKLFMSPPAQKALPPAPSIQTAVYLLNLSISGSKKLIISKSSTFNCLGLFKIIFEKQSVNC